MPLTALALFDTPRPRTARAAPTALTVAVAFVLRVAQPHLRALTRAALAAVRAARRPGRGGLPRHRTWARTAARAAILGALLAPAAAGLTGPPTSGPPMPVLAADSSREVDRVSRSQERAPATTTVVVTDGTDVRTYTAPHGATTIGAALSGQGLVLGELDFLTPDPATPLEPGQELTATVTRVTSAIVTEDVAQPYTSRTIEDPQRDAGTTTVIQSGAPGLVRNAYTVLRDAAGTELSRTLLTSAQVTTAVDEVLAAGTRKPATAPAPASPARAVAAVEPGTARAIALDKVTARGWDQAQFACLDSLWTKESGWRVDADNPTSSAYGIPQALPGSKMASAGADWATNPATQIEWGLGYISGRYGNPCGAWAHSKAKNWY